MSHRHSKKRASSHLLRIILGILFVLSLSLLSRYQQSKDARSKALSQAEITIAPLSPSPAQNKNDFSKNIRQVNQQLDNELLKKSPSTSGLEQKISERKIAVKQLMKDDPVSVLSLTSETKQLQDELPAYLQSEVETETQIEGELLVEISDNFDQNTSTNFHTLIKEDDSRINLHFVEEAPVYESGTRVRASGILLDDQMVITPPIDEGLELIANPGAAANASPYKVAVILINFQNDTSQPFTQEQVRNTTFSTASGTGVNSFHQENSFGKYTLQGHLRSDGDIFGWYTLPVSNTQCSQYLWSQTANQLAAADGFNASNYKAVVYAFPNVSGCAWSGWGTFGGAPARSWINGFYSNFVVAHELGHNFGTNHANAYTCYDSNSSRVSISRSCTSSEYGDPFDVMGSAYLYRHFNSFHKGQAGFFNNGNSQVITTNGEYTISPIETPTGTVQTLAIPTSNYPAHGQQQFYYLEFRQPYGFDQFPISDPVVNGVSIRLGTTFTAPIVVQSQLIDTTPETSSVYDAPLLVGKNFTDRAEGISITTLSMNPTSAKVRIEFSEKECVRMKPKVEFFPNEGSSSSGETTRYYLRVENLDSVNCGISNFSMEGVTPTGFTQQPKNISVDIEPGNYVYISIDLTASQNVPFGSYQFSETVTRGIDNLNMTLNATHHITSNTAPTYTPSPTATPNCIISTGKKADFNKDGIVNLIDYAMLVREFLRPLTIYKADANCDGEVNLTDYSILVREFLR